MGPAPAFVCWLLGSMILAVFASPQEHVGIAILGAGIIGGLTHALLVYRRARKTDAK